MNGTQTTTRRKFLRVKPLVACLALPLAVGDLACTSIAFAVTLPVTNCNDADSGSLRAALAQAHSGDSVDLTALTCGTISLTTGELQVPLDDLTLHGPGANALTISGSQVPGHRYGVLNHTGHGTLHIDALRITDSNAENYYSDNLLAGAPFCIQSTGNVDLDGATVTTCSGGGVFANGFTSRDSSISNNSPVGLVTLVGDVSIESSTISGNRNSSSCAGFVLNRRGAVTTATALISNSTISGNATAGGFNYFYSGFGSGGCIYEPATIRNSTIAFNEGGYESLAIFAPKATLESSIFASNTGGDLVIQYTAQVSGHNNLVMATRSSVPADTITSDPMLLPLADNGGPTQTHALASGSPAIDAGNNLAGLATDQRGLVRVAGARPDIGAFESNAAASTSGSIGAGFTGSWFDPAQSGHGLMVEVLPGNRLLAMWFAFNPQGSQQAWFGGVGTYSGNIATITGVALPTGGRWIPNFDQNAIALNPWGTLTFTFSDCNHGKVDFNSVRGYGSGSMNLTRLTLPAGLTCP
ncbi:MAG TPA: choice-of-anchor Q domain-containing protein [Rudaea sp.]|jgi:hypothetical protein